MLHDDEVMMVWMAMQICKRVEIQARTLSVMSHTGKNLNLRGQKDCGASVEGRRLGRGGRQGRFTRVWGHLVLSHHMASCEAASRKSVLFQLKRRTDRVVDPGNVCSEPTRRVVKSPCDSWRYFLIPERNVGEL